MDEEMTERIAAVIASYLDDLDDPGEVDSDDLAENIVRVIGRTDG
jgi:hypothetical protein